MFHTLPIKGDMKICIYLYDQVITIGLILMLTVSLVVSCVADRPAVISTQFRDTEQVMKRSEDASRSEFDMIQMR